MISFTRTAVAAAAGVVVLAVALAGCSVADTNPAESSAADRTADVPPLGAGYLGSNPSPSPEATVSPERGSWDGVVPPEGYRVVLITAGDDAQTTTVASAVERWAAAGSIDLAVLSAAHDDEVEEHIEAAVDLRPDLVIGAGDDVVDVFTLLTPQHLAQPFLMIGVELPEPTENVSSVIWPGAAYRGSSVGTSGDIDPASFTPERADEAVRAGVAGVLHGLTGIVLSLPQ
ncbi:hypothetical protein GCM10027413_09510 [Conyzicola nivalis]|uniref:BMP family ABC transporter substrate-binding protein n=1 Tax=Conyzicola nivalis TaxID=1477021 RepID=A0A916WJE0_9MICO|nr:BMP family ABC transporter substrate-binding protein [Conyzicola nivalis]GGB03060.1 hypothetical protein GCM10010979_17120 [Conyzicola nivalis]